MSNLFYNSKKPSANLSSYVSPPGVQSVEPCRFDTATSEGRKLQELFLGRKISETVPYLKTVFTGKDVSPGHSLTVLDVRRWTSVESFLVKNEDGSYKTKDDKLLHCMSTGLGSVRPNHGPLLAIMRRSYGVMTWEVEDHEVAFARPPWDSKEEILRAVRTTVAVDGCGSVAGLARFASLPRADNKGVAMITSHEADQALDGVFVMRSPEPVAKSSYRFEGHESLLLFTDSSEDVLVQAHARVGLPVMGRLTDEGVPQKVMAVTKAVMGAVEEASLKGTVAVRTLLDSLRAKSPALLTALLEAKPDYYPVDKVIANQLRLFYNPPVVVKYGLLPVAQPFQKSIYTIGEDFDPDDETIPELAAKATSYKGLKLQGGGAGRLVRALDAQYEGRGFAYGTNGDDLNIFVAVGTPGAPRMLLLATDFSSFAMSTDVKTVFRPAFVRGLGRIRQKVKNSNAEVTLLEYYVLNTPTLTVGSSVYNFGGGAKEGTPLQGLFNDVYAAVYARRVIDAIRLLGGVLTVERISDVVSTVAQGLKLKAKIEHVAIVDGAETILSAINVEPIPLLGGQLWANGEDYVDVRFAGKLDRFAARWSFLGVKEVPTLMVPAMEVLVTSGRLMSFGHPTPYQKKWYDETLSQVLTLPGWSADANLQIEWPDNMDMMVSDELVPRTWGALRTLVEGLPDSLWAFRPVFRAPAIAPVSEEAEELMRRFGLASSVPPASLAATRPMHRDDATAENLGRPPPTKARPANEPTLRVVAVRARGGGGRGARTRRAMQPRERQDALEDAFEVVERDSDPEADPRDYGYESEDV